MLKNSIVASLTLALALCTAAPASAQGAASRYLERRHDEVNRLLRRSADTDTARSRRSTQLATMLGELLDYEELSRRSLGDHWESREGPARERFVTLLRQLVERNYENNLERTLEYDVEYVREARRGEETIVYTEARSRTQRRQPPIAIDYTLRPEGSRFRVVDITTDGVSLVDNYRAQFNRIIDRDGWDALIERMQQRLNTERG